MISVAGPRRVCALVLAALATAASLQAAPGRLDTSKRSVRVSTEEKAVLPENRPIERNEVLMDRRFEGEAFEKESAIVGERRSRIAVEESREKELFRTPERKEYDRVERKDSAWKGKQSRYSTGEDAYRSKVALRFQDKIGDAQPFNGDMKPVVSKRTTFDRINRFVFRKNGGEGVSATTAGSEQGSRDISGASSPGAGGASGASASTPPPTTTKPTVSVSAPTISSSAR